MTEAGQPYQGEALHHFHATELTDHSLLLSTDEEAYQNVGSMMQPVYSCAHHGADLDFLLLEQQHSPARESLCIYVM